MSVNLKTVLAKTYTGEELKLLLTAFKGKSGRELSVHIKVLDTAELNSLVLTLEQARELRNELNDFLEWNYYYDRED